MRRYGAMYFGEGAAANDPYMTSGDPSEQSGSPGNGWAANWNQPTAGTTVDNSGDQIPYYLAPNNAGSGTGGADPYGVGPDGIPYYLRNPNPSSGLPSWVMPVAIGGAAVLVLGALGFISLGKKR